MKPRSGEFYAKNDWLIDELLKDPAYRIFRRGTVWRKSGGVWKQTGKALTNKSGMKYRHLMYRGNNLLVHRIVYRKFNGKLASDLVVNHIDGNSLNNRPANLELLRQQENIQHAHTPHSY